MHKVWKSKIDEAVSNNKMQKLPSGIIKYDFGTMQGIELPRDKFPTANNEPVFFECRKSRELKETDYRGGGCYTRYLYKPNLDVYYPTAFDGDELLEEDLRMRAKVEGYLKDNPQFYP